MDPAGTAITVPAIDAPALVVGAATAVIAAPGGVSAEMPLAEAARALAAGPPPVICHMPWVARRLGTGPFAALDALELYAFVRPATFCLPTVPGIARAAGLARPARLADQAEALREACAVLLDELAAFDGRARDRALAVAEAMARGGWRWGAKVLVALGGGNPTGAPEPRAVAVWRTLPEWQEMAPEPPPGNLPVDPGQAVARLVRLAGEGAESRPQQKHYAREITRAFAPTEQEGEPQVVIAEAGTGVGKTLGYIAPASLWAEANHGAVWISTFTRNLQRQIDGELDRLFPDPVEKARRVVIRKGRENYLCLLNFEEAASRIAIDTGTAVAAGLVARWARATRDGDMNGDFPAWLVDLLGPARTLGLTDRRGECIYAACDHYRRCFIERTVRRARRAELVVANHALVMAQAALGGLDDASVPTRLVFDEGHHLFDAADSAFSAALTGREGAELRRWILGPEEGRRRRARGLAQRIADLAALDETVDRALAETLESARALPGPGWAARLGAAPRGPAERFLALVRRQVLARAHGPDAGYDIETETTPAIPGLVEAAEALSEALAKLAQPLRTLGARLATLLDERASEFDTPTRQRVEAALRGIARRADGEIVAWRAMLDALAEGVPAEFVDWFAVERAGGSDADVGMHRHWVDPMIPFARAVVQSAHGVVVTSATLRDATGDEDADWRAAEARSGARHLPVGAAARAAIASPFDYAARTRVFVVTDIARDDPAQTAAAFRELFVAAGGGGLGLFTAIARLRAVHGRIAPALEAASIPLYAQHVDRMDTSTLIDIFREDERACLLGTDAVRDGVDVPGRSLRLIVFDRVPWPRPTILHRARRAAFTETRYDDMIARLRLKQAYGRLIRRADDCGVFVMLDSRLPSRLRGAFPPGVAVERTGLAQTIAATRDFLAASDG